MEKEFHSSNFYPEKIDGIVILAGATNPYLTKEHKQLNFNDSIERLTESIFLINKYPNAKVIFAGGTGSISFSELDHATVAKKFFENMGINSDKIIFERKSRNTYENLLFAKEIAKPNLNEKWLLITSAFHLRRSLAIAEKLEWNFIPYATDFNKPKNFTLDFSFDLFSNIFQLQKASHEWIGIISYYLMGRSSRVF